MTKNLEDAWKEAVDRQQAEIVRINRQNKYQEELGWLMEEYK